MNEFSSGPEQPGIPHHSALRDAHDAGEQGRVLIPHRDEDVAR